MLVSVVCEFEGAVEFTIIFKALVGRWECFSLRVPEGKERGDDF